MMEAIVMMMKISKLKMTKILILLKTKTGINPINLEDENGSKIN